MDRAALKPRFERIALTQIHPSPNNPRRIRDDDPAIDELAQSLRELGQIEPIVVQELPDSPDHFEILAGERRWRAAKVAGLPDLECKIISVDEQHALEITVCENLQRQDLDPLSEARGVATLLSKGWSVATIAAHLGKTPPWVHRRSKLSALTPIWQQAVAVPDSQAALLGAGHLELIARLTPEQQEAVLKDFRIVVDWQGVPRPVEDLACELNQRFTRELKGAKWDLDDAELVSDAGACSTCTKRSACQQHLFSELADAKDRCLDQVCWETKQAAWLKQRKAEAKEEHGPDLVQISERYYGKGKALGESQYRAAKKTDKGAVPALVTDGSDQGKVVFIKVTKPDQANAKELTPEQQAAAKRKAEREAIANKRADFINEEIIDRLCKSNDIPDDDLLIRLAAVSVDEWDVETKRAFDAKIKTDVLRKELWREVRTRIDPGGVEAEVCKRFGIDLASITAAAAAEHPDLSEGVAEAKAPAATAKGTKKAGKKKVKRGAA
jgi:ParB/RepB/Spo0J family partition protein